MISFGIRRLLYWIMHPRIWKIDQNEWKRIKTVVEAKTAVQVAETRYRMKKSNKEM